MANAIKKDDTQFNKRVLCLLAGMHDMSALTREAAEIMHGSVQENFDVGGRPRWVKLAPATIKRKGHDMPLKGRTGNLQNVVVQSTPNLARIGSNPAAKAYAAIQQYGGAAGRNHRTLIPARPYIVLQPEDWTEIQASAERYVIRLGAA